jgi:hypothetical protein
MIHRGTVRHTGRFQKGPTTYKLIMCMGINFKEAFEELNIQTNQKALLNLLKWHKMYIWSKNVPMRFETILITPTEKWLQL